MYFASSSAFAAAEAERAFEKAMRARGRASLLRRLTRRCMACTRLAIHEAHALRRPAAGPTVREIPLDAIVATLEPNRAEQFDSDFRPSRQTRERWVRVWVGEQGGAGLPPISVVPVGDAFAVRDGHHRVSVARARGAATIAAVVA
jgi:hypothetical protein